MLPYDRTGDGETESHTARVGVASAFNPVEWLEDLLTLAPRNTGSLVFDGDDDALGFGDQAYGGAPPYVTALSTRLETARRKAVGRVLCRVGFAMSQLLGDFPAAFTALNRELRLHPNSVLTLNRLAWVHCHASDREPAVALWERAMRLSPLDPSMGAMLAGLGTAHLIAQRNAEALPLLQRAVQEAPKFVTTHRTLIHALTRLGRPEEARAAAARLLQIRPDYRVSPASTVRFSLAFSEDRRQAELPAGIPE
jgi:tetratricopeptide (TPR) repeat protein